MKCFVPKIPGIDLIEDLYLEYSIISRCYGAAYRLNVRP